MRIVDLDQEPREKWREGVLTRMRVSAANGGTQLCLFEQWCEPGHGAPSHLHAVEEVLHVLAGEADVWVNETHATLKPGQLMIVPAGVGRREARLRQQRQRNAAYPVDARRAGVRGGL
jgi:quercetin dioxygenase-like cupin family protein